MITPPSSPPSDPRSACVDSAWRRAVLGVSARVLDISGPGVPSRRYRLHNARIQGSACNHSRCAGFVSWESKKSGDTRRALFYALGSDTGWTGADSLAWAGDNRHPHPHRTSWPGNVDVSWESDRSGDWEITHHTATSTAERGHGNGRLEISMNPGVDDRHAALELFPVITSGGSHDLLHCFGLGSHRRSFRQYQALQLGGSDWTHRFGRTGAIDRRQPILGRDPGTHGRPCLGSVGRT